ncbi:HlyD family secretion protein [Falsirhodobacter sp. alg1]|uniref:HlyD family secretion protein n=1 Tax=Falsirhodobacter sp. alg1 TaxID=1472418 RepID=UPI0005EEC313|nr:HlyD family secretion protein [Falsirhodobacter sp. alg1]
MGKLIKHPLTIFAVVISLLGVLFILYAWQLPPFRSSVEETNNAYVRSNITFVAPQVAGPIARVAVTDYQEVKQGDLLLQIDDRIYVQKLAQARANLAQQQAQLASAAQQRASAEARVSAANATLDASKVAADVAQRDLDRVNSLSERGITSQAEADTARARVDQSNADVNTAESQVEITKQDVLAAETAKGTAEAGIAAAEAMVELAQIDLDHTSLTAPEDGRLGQVGARVGQYVSAGTQVMGVVPHHTWVIANFKETQIGHMQVGQQATIRIDAYGGVQLTGHIESFSPATGSEFSVLKTDNATGNFTKVTQRVPVRIAIDEDQPMAAQLVPGLSVVVRIDTAQAD